MLSLLAVTLPLMLAAPADRAVTLDTAGVLRWTDDRGEVALFGVNYYAAHWHEYLNLGLVGADRRRVIEQDVAHLKRLGIDLLRVHVFDRELSDHQGNLVANEHLALLDHLLAECRRQGIYAVLTPIAWWGTPNESPGFSTLYTMPQMTGDTGAPRAAQCRYLGQFVQHRNGETGLTYGDDPSIIAFELINEPIYPPGASDQAITDYVNALVEAVRGAGCRKLLFYNSWGGKEAAVAASRIDGVTNNWYPTGLNSGATIDGNMLPVVRRYHAFDSPALVGRPRGIYEFDAANVTRPVMYPAMARSFRAAGVQWAAQFQYDAWPTADTNSDWQTHWLSLPFAPTKALSFMVASAAFHALPRGQAVGSDFEFGPARVSYERAGSEFASDTAFYVAGSTDRSAPKPAALEHLAGGSSPLVRYEGAGAWFLDRLAPGVWRLEVYPDAVQVADPYGPVNLGREVSRLLWARNAMTIALPDLGDDFAVEALNPGSDKPTTVSQGRFGVTPGVYRLARRGVAPVDVDTKWFAPPEKPGLTLAMDHTPPADLPADRPFVVRCTLAPPTGARAQAGGGVLCWSTGGGWQRTPLTATDRYHYQAAVPAAGLVHGQLRYAVGWLGDGPERWWPGKVAPDAAGEGTTTRLLDLARPLADKPDFGGPAEVAAKAEVADGTLRCSAARFGPNQAVGLRLPTTQPPSPAVRADGVVVVRCRATQPATNAFELGLVLDDGRAFGTDVPVTAAWREVTIAQSKLRPLWSTRPGAWQPQAIRQISLVFGSWLYGPRAGQPHGFEVAWIEWRPAPTCWTVPVWSPADGVPLLRPAAAARREQLSRGGTATVGQGPDGQPTLELAHPGFDPAPDSTGLAVELDRGVDLSDALSRCTKLRVKARALTPAATAVELVISEADGTPWGTEIKLATDWQTVELPLSALRLFRHWQVPTGRGAAGDHLDPTRVARVSLTFGAWLNAAAGNQPWRFEIADLSLAP